MRTVAGAFFFLIGLLALSFVGATVDDSYGALGQLVFSLFMAALLAVSWRLSQLLAGSNG